MAIWAIRKEWDSASLYERRNSMGIWQKLFGSKGKESRLYEKAAPTKNISQMVQKTKVRLDCAAIMKRCQTTQEIYSGFRRCLIILVNNNDPLAETVDETLRTEGWNEAQIRGLRDGFVEACLPLIR
jgi:hypothetical protein